VQHQPWPKINDHTFGIYVNHWRDFAIKIPKYGSSQNFFSNQILK